LELTWIYDTALLQFHQPETEEMTTQTQVLEPMAKSKRNDVPVKIDAEVARLARIVAAYEDTSLAEYISERLRPLVQKDLDKHQRQNKIETDKS
jgi:hypothetical protein